MPRVGTFRYSELRKEVDGCEVGAFQIEPTRHKEKRELPLGLETDEKIQKYLLKIFPKLRDDVKQRARAGRWIRVIQLFYKCGYSWQEVADEMNFPSANTTKKILFRIRKTLKGLETHSLKKRKR